MIKSNRKILIIDDNKETVAGLTSFLDRNYNIVSAYDGLEGIQILEKDKEGIDLIITDLIILTISGVTLIKLVKKNYPETPIIAMTGWGHHPEALASEAKADIVLDKPFEMEELHQALEKLSSKMHSERGASRPTPKIDERF